MRGNDPAVLDAKLPGHFSFSAATTFQDCPNRWRYIYLDKAPREFTPSSFVFGGALHAALEMIHFEIYRSRTPTLEQAVHIFSTYFNRESSLVPLRLNKAETPESLKVIAVDLLREYLEDHLPAAGTIASIEERISLEIPTMPVPLEGRVDLLLEYPTDLLVVDAKTSKTAFNDDKVKAASAQIALYAGAYRSQPRFRDKLLRGRFIVFRKLKFPRIEVVDFDLAQTDLNRSQRMLSDTWALIQSAAHSNAFPARRSWACKQCPFQGRCDEQTGSQL